MDNLLMTLWKPKSEWSARTIVKHLRQREEFIDAVKLMRSQMDWISSPPFSGYPLLFLRRHARFARREVSALSKNSEIQAHEETWECLLRIERDYELLEMVSHRDNLPWSIYQLEEMDAILERVRRSYRRAAECLTA